MPTRSRTSTDVPRELEIPEVWGDSWSEEYAEAIEGVDRDIVLAQGRGAHMLRDIRDRTFSFTRLAWLCLWSRTYWTLDTARIALHTSSEYTLEVLARLSFELWLHVEAVAEQSSADRLRAYAAWCISSDIRFQEEMVSPGTLDAIWNPEPARSIFENKRQLAAYERLFGSITLDVDENRLRRGRFRQQDQEQHRLHRLKSWLAHPELAPWKLRLEQILPKQKQPTFFQILDESERSVRSRLRSKDRLFMYLAYSKGSLFVHGSTIEQFLSLSGECVGPRRLNDREECEAVADMVRGQCNSAFVILRLLQGELWNEVNVNGSSA